MADKYLDYKVETWVRVHFRDDMNMQKLVQDIESGQIELQNFEDDVIIRYENLDNAEVPLTPQENDGQSTIEVYDGDKMIWSNELKVEYKDKNV